MRSKTPINDPWDGSQVFGSCTDPPCTRRPWASSEQVLHDWLTRSGWVKTPFGWLCDQHVRLARANAYVVANGGDR